jgi:hypothetical protein
MCTRSHCLQEMAWSGWVSYGVMEAQSITKHISPTQHHQGHLHETGFINTEQHKSWGHSHVLLCKKHKDGFLCEPRHKSPCTVPAGPTGGAQHTGSPRQPQEQAQWDAWTLISVAVVSHPPISPTPPGTGTPETSVASISHWFSFLEVMYGGHLHSQYDLQNKNKETQGVNKVIYIVTFHNMWHFLILKAKITSTPSLF